MRLVRQAIPGHPKGVDTVRRVRFILHRSYHWFDPSPCGDTRKWLGVYSIWAGLSRLAILPALGIPIDLLPARLYGALLTVGGVAVLATGMPHRMRSLGRIAALFLATIWFVLALDMAGAWISVVGALFWVLLSLNEVRAHANF